VATFAGHHRFPEVFRPYSVFDHQRVVLACLPTRAASDVSTSLTVERSRPELRFLGASAHGIHPSKLFPLDWSGIAVAFRMRAAPQTNPTGRSWPMPAYRCQPCYPTRLPVDCHDPLVFRAFLPPRVRPRYAPFTSRIARCSPGFLPLQGFRPPRPEFVFTNLPLSNLVCRPCGRMQACSSAVFSAGRSAFPRHKPNLIST
jgi:hypothetical protein